MKIYAFAFLFIAINALADTTNKPINIPEFNVKISLSNAADLKIKELNEHVIVSVYFYSDNPLPGAPLDDDGVFYIGQSSEQKINAPGVAAFKNLTIPVNEYKFLSTPTYNVNINAFTSRENSTDNHIDCGWAGGPINEIASQTITMHCTLIGEK